MPVSSPTHPLVNISKIKQISENLNVTKNTQICLNQNSLGEKKRVAFSVNLMREPMEETYVMEIFLDWSSHTVICAKVLQMFQQQEELLVLVNNFTDMFKFVQDSNL